MLRYLDFGFSDVMSFVTADVHVEFNSEDQQTIILSSITEYLEGSFWFSFRV